MEYYEVLVRSHRYQSGGPLTYASPQPLLVGSLVRVPLQRAEVMAVVTAKVAKPSFTCKPIAHAYKLPPLPSASLQLLTWLRAYYPAPIGPIMQLFLPPTISADYEAPPSPAIQSQPITLNADQAAAVETMRDAGSYVLHGRTGSGKTRIYATLAQRSLRAGRSVIVLCPEISLTPQLAQTLESLLGIPPITIHSKLTAKQRRQLWQQALTADGPQVVVGPRSALFTPLADIGLIVVDEAHEPAYKQEQQPYYFTPRVAARLAQLHEAVLVLGSATPAIGDYYLAEQKQRPIIRLHRLAVSTGTPVATTVVDLKDRSLFGTSSYISEPLVHALQATLVRHEQGLLYLNRRGTARLSLCRLCGWQATCPHCDLPLAYHGDMHQLLCHTCGFRTSSPTSCPDCGNTDIVFKSAGTKAILAEAQRLFPEARIMRFDTDNSKAERLEQHYQAIREGKVDILVGTQMLAKGLDLPRLSTLGIIMADSSLAIPDFSAQERTYQLISQVLGRVGRGHTAVAEAFIQTYHPDNPTILAAIQGNWDDFYAGELAERRQFGFPPFRQLLKLSCRRTTSRAAEQAARNLLAELQRQYPQLEIDGPTPAFHEKSAGKFEWQLIVKASQRSQLLSVIAQLPKSGWTYDIDPINLL